MKQKNNKYEMNRWIGPLDWHQSEPLIFRKKKLNLIQKLLLKLAKFIIRKLGTTVMETRSIQEKVKNKFKGMKNEK